jgi:putative ABC transport system permease protein
MVAFMVPMLTVLGVRDGIVGTLTARLLENPRNLELTPKGSLNLRREFFDSLAAQPDAAFVTPETRSISATINLSVPDRPSFDADLSASGAGDPLLRETAEAVGRLGSPLGLKEIYLAEAVAEKLGLKAGDTVKGRVGRKRRNRDEYVSVDLTVLGVVPRYITPGYNAFCSLDLMRMTEDYRSGFSAPVLGWEGDPKPEGPERYARFRLYSKDLDGVERLRLHLLRQGIDSYTQAAQIELVKRLDHSFTVIFVALLAVVGGGAFASAASGSVDQVAKMRRSLSVLALLGLSKFQLLIFSMFQAALTGLLAALAAEGLFWAMAEALNSYFGDSLGLGERVCYLAPFKLALAGGLTVFFMVAASGCAYVKLADIEPSEGMRDV